MKAFLLGVILGVIVEAVCRKILNDNAMDK